MFSCLRAATTEFFLYNIYVSPNNCIISFLVGTVPPVPRGRSFKPGGGCGDVSPKAAEGCILQVMMGE